jgi:hypothetical protein
VAVVRVLSYKGRYVQVGTAVVVRVLKYKVCVNTHRDIRSGPYLKGIKVMIQCHEYDKTRCGYPNRAAVNVGTSEEQAE